MAKKGPFKKPLKKGALKAQLGIPKDKPIPASRLDAATHSSDPMERKRAILAKNMRGWRHGG